jgi:hypothetical protein
VQNAERADLVPEILEGKEGFADAASAGPVTRLKRDPERIRCAGCDTNRPRREGPYPKSREMCDDGALANAAHDDAPVDHPAEFRQVIIL